MLKIPACSEASWSFKGGCVLGTLKSFRNLHVLLGYCMIQRGFSELLIGHPWDWIWILYEQVLEEWYGQGAQSGGHSQVTGNKHLG